MSFKPINLCAIVLLSLVLIMTVTSIKDESLTIDELPHLPSGYSYLTQKDMRLNPEHPPLIKDLAALPLLLLKDLNFPLDDKTWTQDVNGQWDFGNKFLFRSGNPSDQMIFLGRLPIILVLLLLGFFVFKWAKELWGEKTALLALFLFSFSPTLLTHGRLVTTDVGAAFGVVLATYFFLKFLREPSFKNVFLAGLALGIGLLTKFSMFLLLPYFAFVLFVWLTINFQSWQQLFKSIIVYGLKFLGLVALAATVIWLIYLFHVWNYPPERQARDSQFLLASNRAIFRENIPQMAYNSVWRPFGQYLLGLTMVIQRGASGNTTYFLGEVSASGWKNYFPVVYAIKEPLAFFVLLILGLLAAALANKKSFSLKNYFSEFSFLVFIVLYWLTSLSGNLNIGVRHLLPVFPFTMMLVSRATFLWLKEPFLKPKTVFLGLLLAWQAGQVWAVFPSFFAYFNELAGGPSRGYVYVVDSNLDWGQDLKRLSQWLEKNKIEKIYLDYFGGADRYYYLGEKQLWWWGTMKPEQMSQSPYLAISATFLQGGRGEPVAGFSGPTGYYRWLDQYEPIAKIGQSIFVYKTRP